MKVVRSFPVIALFISLTCLGLVSGANPKNGNVRGSVISGNGTDFGGSDGVDEVVGEIQDDAAASAELRRLGLENKSDVNDIGGKDYIVTFNNSKNPGISSMKCDDVAKGHMGTVGKKFSKVLNGCVMRLNPKEVNSIRKDPNIQFIEEDKEVYFLEESPAASWGLDRIDQCHLPLDEKMTKKDAGSVKVYILDTGIKGSHNDFDGVLEPSYASCHKDFTNEGNPLDDGHGHGTHVASTACGLTYGVASNCKLCAVKVLNSSGYGTLSGVIGGIEHAAADCAGSTRCVINMSLSGSKSPAINMAVANAVDDGVHVVVAAGNDNADACLASPASEPKAITVGSTTREDARSPFSNWGSCVDIFAPGSGIKAAWIGSNTSTKTISGTSMASPHVAGIAVSIAGTGSFTPAQLTAEMKVMSKQGGVSGSQTSHGDLATDPCRHGGTIAIGHGYKVICKSNPPAGTNAFIYKGRMYHTANYASPVCPSTGADGIQGTLALGNKACLIGTAPSGHNAWMWKNGWYYTDNVTGVCPYRPFPKSRYDGANCFIEKVPKGYVGFTADGNYYTYPKNFCSGHWYDGANCHVQVIPSGLNMRIESNAWVYDVCTYPKIITLGDSYSSGTGLYPRGNQYDEEFGGYVSPWKLTSRADNECWRETDSTLAGSKYSNQVNIPSVNLACKGAEVDHFENQIDLLNFRYPSNAAYGWVGSTILFTIGGNDIETNNGEVWPDVLSACILERNCHKENGNQVANWNDIRTRLDAAYDKLALAAHGAKIRVMGYPRMFQRLTAWYNFDKCPGVTGVNRNEADWADDNIDVLNNILRQAVDSARAAHPGLDMEFVSVNGYITRGACRGTGREINDKVCKNTSTDLCFGDDNISDSSFHPSGAGYRKYSDAFVASL